MNETKFTPGPWKHKSYSVMADGIRISQSVYIGGASVACEEAASKTRKANARLIAAAPDLYEACKAILCQHDVYDTPMLKAIEEKLRAAVAKVEAQQ